MKPYIPEKLPIKNLDYQRLLGLVGVANAELARYDGLLQGVVNSSVMLSPLTNEEAVLSSKIEGTQATVDEVLEQEAGLTKEGEKYKDIQEIINYREALRSGHHYLEERPITLSFIRELHKLLLDSVRGQDKTPGEFRIDQNWIGRTGCSIEQATFVPPDPLHLSPALEDWQKYIAMDDIDCLIQAAVVHAQFELIHPFKDGNGRIGRILIPLFLYQKKRLSQPMFYLSAYLENNREKYYQYLQNISHDNNWNDWIAFFLQATIEQAKSNSCKVKKIMELYESMKSKIYEITHSKFTVHVLDTMFDRPIFDTTDFIERSRVGSKTIHGILKKLKEQGILTTIRSPSGRKPAVLCFRDLLNIAEGKEIV